jgi:hypothetical protein
MSSVKDQKTNDYGKAADKTSWCRFVRATEYNRRGYKIVGLKMCQFGELKCRGAHKDTQLSIPEHIREWNKMDKTNIDILSIQTNIIETLIQEKDKIVNPLYMKTEQSIYKMNFVELIKYWFETTCYHRKVAKELPYKRGFKGSVQPDLLHGFRYSEDAPKFSLKNEDIVWALERTLHHCEAHQKVIDNPGQAHSFFSICCGDTNTCKTGEHGNIACVDSLMYNKCSCLTEEQITEKKKVMDADKTKIDEEIQEIDTEQRSLNDQLRDSVDADGYKIILSKKTREIIMANKQKLDERKRMLNRTKEDIENAKTKLVRKIHYSDMGMLSLAQRNAMAEEVKKESKVVDVAKIEITTVMPKLGKKKY